MSDKQERIGGVTLNYDFFDGLESYSEGEEGEACVLQALKDGRDIFDLLKEGVKSPIVLYQLSPLRKFITSVMDIKKTDAVLEIGSGMGAVTEALASKAKCVDCIDLSMQRSLANAYRNKSKDNITIFVGSFERISLEKKYDAAILVGALEYAQLYAEGPDVFVDFLKQIKDILNPGGLIYVAIENRLGMRYFSGCAEDHWGQPYVGIEGYSDDIKNNRARTFSKSELISILESAGFGELHFYYPFPDYKLPEIIYSDSYLPDASSFIPIGTVYGADNIYMFDELRAMKSVAGTEEFATFSNSFLVEAKNT